MYGLPSSMDDRKILAVDSVDGFQARLPVRLCPKSRARLNPTMGCHQGIKSDGSLYYTYNLRPRDQNMSLPLRDQSVVFEYIILAFIPFHLV
jgi:hypothetical protein